MLKASLLIGVRPLIGSHPRREEACFLAKADTDKEGTIQPDTDIEGTIQPVNKWCFPPCEVRPQLQVGWCLKGTGKRQDQEDGRQRELGYE